MAKMTTRDKRKLLERLRGPVSFDLEGLVVTCPSCGKRHAVPWPAVEKHLETRMFHRRVRRIDQVTIEQGGCIL